MLPRKSTNVEKEEGHMSIACTVLVHTCKNTPMVYDSEKLYGFW